MKIKAILAAVGLLFLTACADVKTDWETIIHDVSASIEMNPGVCSGVVVSESTVLTAGHCVDSLLQRANEHKDKGEIVGCSNCAHMFKDIYVYVKIGGVQYLARIHQFDKVNDLALLTIPGVKFKHWAKLADTRPKVGDDVYCLGNPAGIAPDSFTKGILSHFSRTFEDIKSSAFYQSDCSIHGGNSGGGLFNSRGELAGINVIGLFVSNITGAPYHFGTNYTYSVSLSTIKDFLSGKIGHINDKNV